MKIKNEKDINSTEEKIAEVSAQIETFVSEIQKENIIPELESSNKEVLKRALHLFTVKIPEFSIEEFVDETIKQTNVAMTQLAGTAKLMDMLTKMLFETSKVAEQSWKNYPNLKNLAKALLYNFIKLNQGKEITEDIWGKDSPVNYKMYYSLENNDHNQLSHTLRWVFDNEYLYALKLQLNAAEIKGVLETVDASPEFAKVASQRNGVLSQLISEGWKHAASTIIQKHPVWKKSILVTTLKKSKVLFGKENTFVQKWVFNAHAPYEYLTNENSFPMDENTLKFIKDIETETAKNKEESQKK